MSIQHLAVWEEVDEFLTSTPTPEQIVAFHPSEAAQQRLRDLLDRNREGRLTAEETTELDQFLAVDMFVSRLKVKALGKLDK